MTIIDRRKYDLYFFGVIKILIEEWKSLEPVVGCSNEFQQMMEAPQ